MKEIEMVLWVKNQYEYFKCPNHSIILDLNDKIYNGVIKKYESSIEAMAAGWLQTNHYKFCPSNCKSCLICPSCAKKLEALLKKNKK